MPGLDYNVEDRIRELGEDPATAYANAGGPFAPLPIGVGPPAAPVGLSPELVANYQRPKNYAIEAPKRAPANAAPATSTGSFADTQDGNVLPDLHAAPAVAQPIEPPSSWSDVFHATSNSTFRHSSVTAADARLSDGYAPIVRLLGLPDSENPGRFNEDDPELAPGEIGSPSLLAARAGQGAQTGGASLVTRGAQEMLIVDAIKQRRLEDPKFAPGVPDTIDGLHKLFLEQSKQAEAADQATIARGPGGVSGFTAALAGSAAGTFRDPLNIGANVATLAIPGGGGIITTIARDALINGALELVEQPVVAHNTAELGENYTAMTAAENVATAAAAGGAFGAVLHGGAKAIKAAVPSVGKLFAALPEAARTAWASRMGDASAPATEFFSHLDNQELAQFASDAHGGKLTPDEQAATNVVNRTQEVGASSPFQAGAAGDGAHSGALAAAIKDIEDRVAPGVETAPSSLGASEPAAALGSPSAPAAERPPEGLSPSRRPQQATSVDAAIESFKAKVGGAENATGNVNAKNPLSSASGPEQFTDGTFRDYYRKVYGEDPGAHPAQALKNDPAVQHRLLDALTRDNAAHLQSLGEAVNDGNLYLEHFLGSGDAAKIFRAGADTPVDQLLPESVLHANPFLRGKSASEVIAWSHGKMGAHVASVGAKSGFATNLDPASEDPLTAQLSADALQLEPQVIGAPHAASGEVPPMTTGSFKVDDITVDANRFQFKSGGDASGVTERLRGVEQWNPVFAGRVMAWEDNEGRLFLADGHQRYGLAKRIQDATGQPISLDAAVLREADGISAEDARTYAALKNISEGSGTAIDAAKVIRDAGPRVLDHLPPRSALVRDGGALARLSDSAFGAVYNGVIPPDYAAVIGHLLPDRPQAHEAMVDLLLKTDPANRGQAESIVRQGMAAGLHVEHQDTLFGARELTTSLMLERAKVLEKGLAELRKMRLVHKTAAENAGALEATGSAIAREASTKEAQANAQAVEIVSRLAFSHGPVADALNAAARDLAGGAKLATVARTFAEHVRKLDLTELGAGAGETAGNDGNRLAVDGSGRGGDAGEASSAISAQPGDREQPGLLELEHATERFSDPDGKAVQQQAASLEHDLKADLAPPEKVDPAIAERQRQEIALRAASPKRPGAVDAEGTIGLGLFDKANQGDLTFRLSEEGGDVKPQDLLDDLDADAAAIKAIKDCL